MKTYKDAPADWKGIEAHAWADGYRECMKDHEYMDTHAHLHAQITSLKAKLSVYETQNKAMQSALRTINIWSTVDNDIDVQMVIRLTDKALKDEIRRAASDNQYRSDTEAA